MLVGGSRTKFNADFYDFGTKIMDSAFEELRDPYFSACTVNYAQCNETRSIFKSTIFSYDSIETKSFCAFDFILVQ